MNKERGTERRRQERECMKKKKRAAKGKKTERDTGNGKVKNIPRKTNKGASTKTNQHTSEQKKSILN